MPRSVTTLVELNTQEIKFLVDLMWATDERIAKQVANRHGVDDNQLEKHLQINLGSALAEL